MSEDERLLFMANMKVALARITLIQAQTDLNQIRLLLKAKQEMDRISAEPYEELFGLKDDEDEPGEEAS